MTTGRKFLALGVVTALAVWICAAQPPGPMRGGGGGGGRGGFGGGGRFGGETGPFVRTEGGDLVNEDTVHTARETASHSTGTAVWTNEPGFEKDAFTFTRIIYKRATNFANRGGFGGRGGGFGGRGPGWMGWINDYPDSDLNLSFRIQQMTTLHTDPDGRTLKLCGPDKQMNPELTDYPWIYMVKPGRMELREEEVPVLRKYLLNGGVLWADDFWGQGDWNSFESQIKRVLPERNWTELPMDHPLFHCVFNITVEKNKLQVPSIQRWERGGDGRYGYGGEDTHEVHVRAWHDEKKRIMVIATHNTDNGDGWEREGENHEYFQIFSEQRAYPLGINVIFYVMTH